MFLFSLLPAYGQQAAIEGAWRLAEEQGGAFSQGQVVLIYQDQYCMFAQYGDDGSFIRAGGGAATLQDGTLELLLDFYTADSSLVRQKRSFPCRLVGDELEVDVNGSSLRFSRIDKGESPLSGAWRFASRLDREGNPGERRGDGPRQTVKILSGERFQWAAFNFETKQFMATGGGTYQLKDGRYIETIEFFSKDSSRVGLSLGFDYEVKGDDWYHRGQSSTGNPVREIWEKKR